MNRLIMRIASCLVIAALASGLGGCAGTSSGRTVRVEDGYGQPISGAQVQLITPTGQGDGYSRTDIGTTSSTGRISLGGLPLSTKNTRLAKSYLITKNGFQPFWVGSDMLNGNPAAGWGFHLKDSVLIINLSVDPGTVLLPP